LKKNTPKSTFIHLNKIIMKTIITSFKRVVFLAIFLSMALVQQLSAQGATQNQTELSANQPYGLGTIYQRMVNVMVTTTAASVQITNLEFTLTNPEQIARVSLVQSSNSLPDFTVAANFLGTPVANPSATVSFTGSYTQASAGTRSFYLLVDIKPDAIVGTEIDAVCTSVTTTQGTFTPSAMTNDKVAVVATNLTGTKTIANSGGDYATLNAAIIALNNYGVGEGGVTFEVADDQTFAHTSTSSVISLIRQTGTATKPIVIKRSGTGAAKPIINCPATSSATDAFIGAVGVDYLTIDGLDLRATGATSSVRLERAIYFLGRYDKGCNYNVVKNCVINPADTYNNTRIYGISFTSRASQAEGTNNFNKIHNNTISNTDAGVDFNFGATLTFFDEGNEIYNNTITGQFAIEVGGIRIAFCKDTKIYNNVLDGSGVTTTYHTTDRLGISTTSATCRGYVHIYGNVVKNMATNNNNQHVYGIMALAPTVLMYNNVVANITNNSVLLRTRNLAGIAMSTDNTLMPTYFLYHNSVYLNQTTTDPLMVTAAATNVGGLGLGGITMVNNVFVNASLTGTPDKNFAFYIPNKATSDLKVPTDYNLYYGNETATYIGVGGPTIYSSVDLYKASAHLVNNNKEQNSISGDPLFVDVTASELHITDANSPASNAGTALAAVTTDINGIARHPGKPDLGAYEDSHVPVSTYLSNLHKTGLQVYNANGTIYADLTSLKGTSTVTVYDLSGSIIRIIKAGSGLVSVDVPAKGLYIVRIENNTNQSTLKTIVL
jgi:hypothetical protein